MAFYNLAREYTTTTGTGTVTLTGAVPGMLTWDLAGVPNAAAVSYSIITYDTTTHRPTGAEAGSGTYTTSGKTLARTTVENSTNAGAKITLTGLSEVFITPLASDYAGFGGGGSAFAVYQSTASDSIANAGVTDPLAITAEVVDASGCFTLAGNILTCAVEGWYEVTVQADALDSTNFGNGEYAMWMNSTGPLPAYLPYLSIQTTSTSAKIELNFTFSGSVALEAADTISFGCENNTGGTVVFQLMNITIKRLGDL